MVYGQLALVFTAAFSGAALYVSFAEQPARLMLDDHALLAEWKPSYRRGFAMQAPLAVVGFVFGLMAWWQEGEPAFIVGAALIIAPWPWTLLAIKPTTKALMTIEPADASRKVRALVSRWGLLHAVRTALGTLATISFLLGCTN